MEKITLRTAEDAIDAAAAALGYTPEDSLVLLGILRPEESAGRTLAVLRIDYSTAAALEMHDTGARQLCQLVRQLGAVKVIVPVVFSDALAHITGCGGAPVEDGAWAVHRAGILTLCDALCEERLTVGSPVWTGLGVCGDFRSRDARSACRSSRGTGEDADFSAAAALPAPDPHTAAELAAHTGCPGCALGAFIRELLAAEQAVAAGRLSPRAAAAGLSAAALAGVLGLLEHKPSRDFLLLLTPLQNPGITPADVPVTEDCRVLTAWVERLLGDVITDDYLEKRAIGYSARPPDFQRLELSCEVMKTVAAYADAATVGDALAVLAWLEWVRGRSSFSEHYVQAALGFSPESEFAGLQAAVIRCGILPMWMR